MNAALKVLAADPVASALGLSIAFAAACGGASMILLAAAVVIGACGGGRRRKRPRHNGFQPVDGSTIR